MQFKNDSGAVIIRVILGAIFLIHGLAKFEGGINNISGWFGTIGLPGFMAYVVAGIEVIGGIALIIGLGTRLVSALFVLLMIGAIIKVKFAAGFLGNGKMAGYELELSYLAMALFLVINGGKQFSVSQLFVKNESSENLNY